MPRAVANTLLPAARPASTIARPRPRELPVTNHTCAIHPPLTHRKRTDQCKELEDSDAAKQRSPGLCRDKAEASSLGRSFRARESSQQFPYFSEKASPHFGLQGFDKPCKVRCFWGPTVSRWFWPSCPYCGMN